MLKHEELSRTNSLKFCKTNEQNKQTLAHLLTTSNAAEPFWFTYISNIGLTRALDRVWTNSKWTLITKGRFTLITRMHSSRMRTGRSLTVCGRLLGGGGFCSRGGEGSGIPACTEADTPPLWTESQTPVKTLPWPNFVAAGKYNLATPNS